MTLHGLNWIYSACRTTNAWAMSVSFNSFALALACLYLQMRTSSRFVPIRLIGLDSFQSESSFITAHPIDKYEQRRAKTFYCRREKRSSTRLKREAIPRLIGSKLLSLVGSSVALIKSHSWDLWWNSFNQSRRISPNINPLELIIGLLAATAKAKWNFMLIALEWCSTTELRLGLEHHQIRGKFSASLLINLLSRSGRSFIIGDVCCGGGKCINSHEASGVISLIASRREREKKTSKIASALQIFMYCSPTSAASLLIFIAKTKINHVWGIFWNAFRFFFVPRFGCFGWVLWGERAENWDS